ncbi:MAG: GIY-YIG nuclease family protein [Candidatus Jorgensenbacteria bacterium]
MFYVYVLESVAGDLYTGYTDDLKRRLEEHNRGISFYTKRGQNWRVIYYEACTNQNDAKRRENISKQPKGAVFSSED